MVQAIPAPRPPLRTPSFAPAVVGSQRLPYYQYIDLSSAPIDLFRPLQHPAPSVWKENKYIKRKKIGKSRAKKKETGFNKAHTEHEKIVMLQYSTTLGCLPYEPFLTARHPAPYLRAGLAPAPAGNTCRARENVAAAGKRRGFRQHDCPPRIPNTPNNQ